MRFQQLECGPTWKKVDERPQGRGLKCWDDAPVSFELRDLGKSNLHSVLAFL